MKLAIIGSREFDSISEFREAYKNLIAEEPELIISGAAAGADSLAEEFANKNAIPYLIFPANWERDGKGAGFLRNFKIVDSADKVLAFQNAESTGTYHSINYALTKGKEVIIHYFAMPKKEHARPISNTLDSNCWLRDDFPCKIIHRDIEYASVAAAMKAACAHRTENYLDIEWINSLDKTQKDGLLKLMYSFQEQKFGAENPYLRERMRLQIGDFKLKPDAFWNNWMNKIFTKVRNEIKAEVTNNN